MLVEKVVMYKTSDGSLFEVEEKAKRHEWEQRFVKWYDEEKPQVRGFNVMPITLLEWLERHWEELTEFMKGQVEANLED